MEILLYQDIGSGGKSSADFAKDLQSAAGGRITLRINSAGGNVFDGYAIYNLLKRYAGGVDVYIDGLAASIASYIAMAGTRVSMAKNAMMMIHRPGREMFSGNADEFRKSADVLDQVESSLVDSYTSRTGIPAAEISKMLDEETWLAADQALAFGFIDEITPELAMAAHVTPEQLATFKNAPKNLKIESPRKPMEPILTPIYNVLNPEPAPVAPVAGPDKPSIFSRVSAMLKEKSSIVDLTAKHQAEMKVKDGEINQVKMQLDATVLLLNAAKTELAQFVAEKKELEAAVEKLGQEKKTSTEEATNIVASLGFDLNNLPKQESAEDADARRLAGEPKTSEEWNAKFAAIKDPVEKTKFMREHGDKIADCIATEKRTAKAKAA